MVLAHELTHALEDQRFGLPSDRGRRATTARSPASRSSKAPRRWSCRSTCSATSASRRRSAAARRRVCRAAPTCPKFLQAQLLFPYIGGMAFVQALRKRAGGSWKLVDLAERLRVPDSTEQVLHPEKWIAVEPPLPVRAATSRSGAGWRRVGERDLRRVADRASCSATPRRPRRGGAATATSSGSAARARRRRRAARRRAGRCAGAGTRRATRASSRPRCGPRRWRGRTVPPCRRR